MTGPTTKPAAAATTVESTEFEDKVRGYKNISAEYGGNSSTDNDDAQSEEGSVGVADLGESIDVLTFEQILEMDDDEEEREFSRSIVFGFFEQAEQTFVKMDDAVRAKDLETLASLGHFLKGSSATLGLTKVKDSCEKIQHYGQKKDEDGTTDCPDEAKCLKRIEDTIETVKEDYAEVEKILRRFYAS